MFFAFLEVPRVKLYYRVTVRPAQRRRYGLPGFPEGEKLSIGDVEEFLVPDVPGDPVGMIPADSRPSPGGGGSSQSAVENYSG
jgi:hypothetical protein